MKSYTYCLLSIILLSLSFFLVSCDSKESEELILESCYNEELGEEILCGTYEVMENHQVRKGAKIRLNFIILPARIANPDPDPIFAFDGGPGCGAAAGINFWARSLEKFRGERDIILLDQRGTGESNPLPCFPLGDPNSAQTWLKDMYSVEYVVNCRKELDKKADLRYYSTLMFADDLDNLRAALGYERINVIGGSYGGYSGYIYMKYHPQRVRSAVLWSITPQYYPSNLAPDTEAAMERLFDDCAADPDCDADYPDLRQDFQQVLNQLKTGPVTVTITNPFTGSPETVEFRYNDFITGIRYTLYNNDSLRWTPVFIYWAAQGNYAPLISYTVTTLRDFNEYLMDGMFLCIQCTENIPYIDWDEAVTAAEGTFMGTYRLEQHKQACDLWVRGDLPDGYFDLNMLSIPTLIVSGELDPVDPPKYSQKVADSLPNSLHKIIPLHAHGVSGVWENCLDDAVLRFVSMGSLEGLDLSCVDAYQRPSFVSWRNWQTHQTQNLFTGKISNFSKSMIYLCF